MEVKNNPDKFPEGFILETNQDEKFELVKNFDRFNKLKHSTVFPSAFTEKGLYMLATILKGARATQTTIAILLLAVFAMLFPQPKVTSGFFERNFYLSVCIF